MSTDKTADEQQPKRTPRASRRTGRDQAIQAVTPVARHEGAVTAKKDRPTPSRRKIEEEAEDEGNVVVRTGSGILDYLQGVRSELDKVTWPTREDARRLTIIVLIALVASALLLGMIALGFTELFRIGLESPLVIFGAMFIAVAAAVYWNRRNRSKSTAL